MPQPQHFIIRPGEKSQTTVGSVIHPGELVPLIPLDQIPEWVEIVDVPRFLRPSDVANMYGLGTVAKTGMYDVKVHVPETETIRHVKNEKTTKEAQVSSEGCAVLPTAPPRSHGDGNAGGIQLSQQAPADPTSTSRSSKNLDPTISHDHALDAVSTPAASKMTVGSVPKPSPKLLNTTPDGIYCRHWCKHGTCKWGMYCRYQHVMPMTAEGLRSVGLAEPPVWWRTAALGMGVLPLGDRGQRHNRPLSGLIPGAPVPLPMHHVGTPMGIDINPAQIPGIGAERMGGFGGILGGTKVQHQAPMLGRHDTEAMRLQQIAMAAFVAGVNSLGNSQANQVVKESYGGRAAGSSAASGKGSQAPQTKVEESKESGRLVVEESELEPASVPPRRVDAMRVTQGLDPLQKHVGQNPPALEGPAAAVNIQPQTTGSLLDL